jgi:hypothetical protein
MAQSLVAKRQNLASRTVTQVTALVDAIRSLDALQDEYVQETGESGGAFAQTDFDGTSLTHLTPGMMTAMFAGNGVVDSLLGWYVNNAAVGTPSSIVNKQNLLQMRA